MGELLIGSIFLCGIWIFVRIIIGLIRQQNIIRTGSSYEKDAVIKKIIKKEINGFVSNTIEEVKNPKRILKLFLAIPLMVFLMFLISVIILSLVY
ncbi:hypothetical protein [Clostridium grantii]|uniref:Uncharacterized protein n=1 Tax=Clostridium grantii DSM 8605 TaxID=1121316 RepID=A0A1M5Y6F0_9CLOT|nr:hypothetical protein [Clostridium grantii]SHI07650.1 hypothetical protein SAMN02745207_04242 [Clostridium grantii DSM 8605]